MENVSSGKPKPVILTCAQPTGVLTLGNYLGAVRNWSEMLDHNECYFGIVDLHAITTPAQPAILRQNVYQCVAQYIACGLDPEKCHQFVQSHVIGHTELAWVLTCITPIGELQRMTQFKDKVAKLGFKVSENIDGDDLKFEHQGARAQASINTGLLCYPVLMAADILLYNADRVPVGEDQRQHLELCRDLAQRFNHQYSETFIIPEPFVPKTGARIMSLAEPTRKMSKSDENEKATLYILDEPDRIRKKLASAVTDSGSEIKSAEILGAITASKTEKEFKDYFFNEYGQDAFAEGEMDILVKYYLDKETEEAEEEKEEDKEAEAEEGGEEDDPLAGI